VRIPQDLANLLAVAIRDVIWFKKAVISFLEECGTPRPVLIEAERMYEEGKNTIPVVKHVLERLTGYSSDGEKPMLQMLTKMYYWKDVYSITDQKRKNRAISSLNELQKAYKKFRDQEDFQKDQEEKMQRDRVDRVRMSELDHAKLQAFRDEFDRIHRIGDAQERGNEFEKLMNAVFDYYCEEYRECGLHCSRTSIPQDNRHTGWQS